MKPQNPIHYKAGYKYRLEQDWIDTIPVTFDEWLMLKRAGRPIKTKTPWIELTWSSTIEGAMTTGDHLIIHLRAGYAWDGPSGPAQDTPSFMRASLVHDALYQLMRLQLLPQAFRPAADRIMTRYTELDGMWPLRRWWTHRAVRLAAGYAASPKNQKPVLKAPR